MDAANTSPVNYQYGNVQNQHYYNVTSPNNSDGNHYQSPLISPGYWDVSPPPAACNQVSPQSNVSFQGTPNSTASKEIRSSPPSTPPRSFEVPNLPTRIGSQNAKGTSGKNMASVNKHFMEKSSMEKEREKIASRRAQSMMLEVSRKQGRAYKQEAFGKKDAKSFLVPNGTENFATSSRVTKKEPMVMEDLKGSVNDFKCGLDRDREWAAKKHALRIITKLNNAA